MFARDKAEGRLVPLLPIGKDLVFKKSLRAPIDEVALQRGVVIFLLFMFSERDLGLNQG